MFPSVDPYGITGKYPGFCGRFNSEPFRIRYRYVYMTRPSSSLLHSPRLPWVYPSFVFSLKWASLMSCYIGSSSTLVRKLIVKEDLIYFTFEMVLDTLLVVGSGSFSRRRVEAKK